MTATTTRASEAAEMYAAMTVAGQPVAVKTCPRCQGTGRLAAYDFNNHGKCARCGGRTIVPVYTPEQKAWIARADAATQTLSAHLTADRSRVAYTYPDGGTYRTAVAQIARVALSHLRAAAPTRFDRLVVSVERGRVADVAAGLVTYAQAEKLVP